MLITQGSGPLTYNTLTLNDNVSLFGVTLASNMYTSTVGRTTVSSSITENTLLLLCFGQSIAINQSPTPYTPINSSAHAFNPYDSLVYRAKDPEIGSWLSGHNFLTNLTDKLITDGKFSRVVLFPQAIGSTSSFDWSPSGVLNQRVRIAALQIRKFGWDTNPNVKIAVLWIQGQGDFGTSSLTYQSRYRSIQDTMIGMGLNVDWFVAISTMNAFVVDPVIQGAQAAVVDNIRTFAGANMDSLTGPNLDGGGTHLSDAGCVSAANLWAPILEAHF